MRREALLVTLLSLLLLVTVGAELTARLGLLGILVAELALVGIPAWLWLGFRHLSAERLGLALSQQRVRTLLGGALAGLGAFYLMALFQKLVLERFLPMPEELKASLHRMVAPGGWKALSAELLALALAPAVCEELLFRGGVLTAFSGRSRASRALAIAVAALAFGIFHVSLYRLIPATLLGLVLGVVRVASGSLIASMAFHFANNAAVIAMVRLGYDEPPALATRLGLYAAIAAAVALVTGLALSIRRVQPS